ncbi:MAG: nicotinate-nucleotide--dimethylbenzimidazole phosphoribosyltransferase, partial [Hominilimicola sp.]
MYKIKEISKEAIENSKKQWNSIAKPLHSLGVFEDIVTDIAGIQGTHDIDIDKRCVLVMCADNGVVCEGVTQTGQEVTAIVTENFVKGDTSVCAMARRVNADVIPVDVGVARDVDGAMDKKMSYGTKNMLHERAMKYEQAQMAIQIGVD